MLPAEWQPKVHFPVILGTDVSGVIETLADDVKGFTIGDEVYSMVRFPSGTAGDSRAYAEYVSVPEEGTDSPLELRLYCEPGLGQTNMGTHGPSRASYDRCGNGSIAHWSAAELAIQVVSPAANAA
jgi:hypothetical protein